MSIYTVDPNLPTSSKIVLLNSMIKELEGRAEQGKFDKNEIDQLFSDIGINRQFLRNISLGHTISDYDDWVAFHTETGYDIWKIPVSDYKYNTNNQLLMDTKLMNFKGEAIAEVATFNTVLFYDSTGGEESGTYNDVSSEAAIEGGTAFNAPQVASADYLYIGSTIAFGGTKFEFQTRGDNYTLKIEYWNGAWVELTSDDNITDNTSNFNNDGTITWDLPTDWTTCIVNSFLNYWVRISTTSTPIIQAEIYYLIPSSSVIGLLALTGDDIIKENWAWCSYYGNIYVTIRNSGNTSYEGSYYLATSSSETNKRNYFIHNHEFLANYENSSFNGNTVSIESGVSYGDLVYISDQYTFNAADADVWRKRCMGILISPGYVKMTDGLVQNVNTIGSANIVPGDVLYLSETPGKVTRTAPEPGSGRIQQRVGIAIAYETSGNVVDMIFKPEYV